VEPRMEPRVEPRVEPYVEPRVEPPHEPRVIPRVERRIERVPEPQLEPVEAAPPTTYGAPVTRDAVTTRAHHRAFVADVAPTDVAEPGELDDHLVSVLEPTSFAAEQYRAARLAIETFRRERGTKIVAVSSPGRGDGKTITAVNLAGALAQASDARVVLVDADLRHPGTAKSLGLPGGRGLSTFLLDTRTTVDDIVERPAGLTFAVIPAGPVSSMPYELLKSPRLASLLASLRERFDFVVVDTPPVLPYPDVGILRDAVDGFVMIVRANRTTRELLRDSLNAVGRPRTLGLIYNDDDRSSISVAGEEQDEGGWRRYLSIGGS
jgi:capsular exopolysaccharide synthesis family protein